MRDPCFRDHDHEHSIDIVVDEFELFLCFCEMIPDI